MSKRRARRAGAAGTSRRKPRRRPVPKWIKDYAGADMIARRRCLMVLSVLSGEKPVSEAIKEAAISRPAYYQMETRALNGMLGALDPRSAKRKGPRTEGSMAHLEKLMKRIRQLEQDRRRIGRLLLLTRKAVRPHMGLMTPGRMRLRKRMRLGLTPIGRRHSRASEPKAMATCPSIPTKAGESRC